ncbi:MAG: hypothetical protein E5W90_07780 [Mesorhizobium sp.]|nr:MAG: hypothetical protein E5W90_07780 [Mesorhizobium sp.]
MTRVPARKTDSFQGFLWEKRISGGKPEKDSDEKRFNATLKRMLKTPPTPQTASKKDAAHSAVDSRKVLHKKK